MDNLIIETDNLLALENLLKDYNNKIDIISIDPPYNTKIDHIKYKDKDFDGGWQTFMRLRLKIAYKLLSNTGVMFIHIDENELFNLTALCKDIFGMENVNILIWKKVNEIFDKNRVEKFTNKIRLAHEYIVLCYKDKANTEFNRLKSGQYMESIVDGFGTTSSAKDELSELFGDRKVFSTPKPMHLIKEFIRIASNKNSIILDFFAGSGTTGHAVMDLNKEDNGTRKFILITNNEGDICRDVTIPRIQKAIVKYEYEETFKILLTDEYLPIGMKVDVVMDRPIGTEHPKHKGLFYPINYGYIAGLLGGDNEEQDVYILGIDEPIRNFTGIVIAVVKRFDDVETKWVVAPFGKTYSKDEIAKAVDFQEKYYKTKILYK